MSAMRLFRPLGALLAAATLLGAASTGAPDGVTAGADGKYVAVLFNKRPLPAEEKVPSTKGYHHYVKVDEAVLDLRPDGKFTASFRYYHDMVKDGARVPPLRLMRETHRGTYKVSGASVTFFPEPGKKAKLPRPVVGVLAGSVMKVDYQVDDGAGPRMLRFELKKQASWYLEGH